MINRKSQTEHWKNQKSANISEAYFTSPPGILRSKFFVEQLKQYEFDSIFEVGCMSCRNLFYIREAFPKVKLGGLDINSRAIRYARDKMNLDKELVCMDLHSMSDITDTFDIVFSSGVLIHIPPDDISGVLQKMLDRTNKYVMHIEQNGDNRVTAGPKHMKPSYKVSDQIQFAPDLIGEYKKLGYDVQTINLPDDCKTNGASELIIVELQNETT